MDKEGGSQFGGRGAVARLAAEIRCVKDYGVSPFMFSTPCDHRTILQTY